MTAFRPLLAATAPEDLSTLRYPLLASPKLDGIRCVKLDGKALSRTLKPIPNRFVREWVEANLPDGIDGELLLRDWTAPFAEVSSAIMSRDGEPDFTFAAFDHFNGDGWEFNRRLERLHQLRRGHEDEAPLVGMERKTRLVVVPHEEVESLSKLQVVVPYHVAQGYEGTMVRDPAGRYKFGRSTVKEGILLKIKAFVDEEATVVGVVEEMHNGNEATVDALGRTKRSTAKEGKTGKGRLGAFVLRLDDGTEFECGSGLTDAQKVELWKPFGDMQEKMAAHAGTRSRHASVVIVGEKVFPPVKFKHLPPPGGRPAGQKPRHPVFLGFRED